jgi:hypothetical protein
MRFLNFCGFYFLSLLNFWLKRLWGGALGSIAKKPILDNLLSVQPWLKKN